MAKPHPDEQPGNGPFLGLAEVAELLGVTKRTAVNYTARDDFPGPVQELAATSIWRCEDVLAWAADALPLRRGRRPRTG